MTANPAMLPDRQVKLDGEVERSLSLVRADAKAVVLYGSRARGTHRTDSDVDILAIVATSPGSFHQAMTSITYYTEEHLCALARNGSLFVRHLRDEGRIVFDRLGAFERVTESFKNTSDNSSLQSEIAVVLAALRVLDRDLYSAGLARAGAWAARTALYLKLQSENKLTFDLDEACQRVGNPNLARLIQAAREGCADLERLAEAGLYLLSKDDKSAQDWSLADFTLNAWADYKIAPKILESVLAGEAKLAYTELTLPPG